ncbi:MAG TPA: hypothetical protein VHA35_19080 [Dongiaceae bacterium]|nr:hypothetical protein [Dongiaceae bacterium]
MQMKLLVAAAAMAVAGWAGAAGASTVTGSGTTNDLGQLFAGGSLTVTTEGYAGIANGPYDGGRTYFDFIYKFDVMDDVSLHGDIFNTGANNFAEFHLILSNDDPKNTVLYYNNDPDEYEHFDDDGNQIPNTNLLDIGKTTPFNSASGSNGNGVGIPPTSLTAGTTYYLRLFGVSTTDAINAFSGVLTTSVAATPIPPALLLFLTGLGGLGFTGWRRRKAALA